MKYGFIGCGNMGGALARAISCAEKSIMVSDFDARKAEQFAASLGVTAADNATVAKECDRIFLGVKPQMMQDMLSGIKNELQDKKPILISMAAGLKISQIQNFAGGDLPVIRIMPNTPVSVGKGVVLYCAEGVQKDVLDDFALDMRYCGILDLIDESLIDAGCSVSGCGPAFMYMFANAVAKGGEQCGLSRGQAIKYAAATMSGAAEMLMTSEKTPEELTDAVCSKGGSTIEGVNVLKNSDFESVVSNCIKAAFKRNLELGGK